MSLDRVVEEAARDIAETKIRAAVAEALGKDPRALIERVVDAALSARPDPYSREPVLQKAIREMIVEEAKAAFADWIEENRTVVRRAVAARLRDTKKGLIDRVADRWRAWSRTST